MEQGKEYLFSAKFACPVCNYSLQELEPRLFSFKQSDGRVPGVRRARRHRVFRSEARRRLSAHEPRQRRDQGLGPAQPVLFLDAAEPGAHYKFELDKAFEKLPGSDRQAILYGSGSEKIAFQYINDAADVDSASTAFEGHHPESRAALSRDRFGSWCARNWPST
jgi:excinuclease ABC subunit A